MTSQETDQAMLDARRSLAERMQEADNLEGAAKLLAADIVDAGGLLSLPTLADQVAQRHVVELQVHGLSVTAPTVEQAAEAWLDHALLCLERAA